ncbi:helix-turn-helix transcriptional regulator [Brachybacterium sp. AOP42-C2-15]|uniref:helix-turn-helix transcriptional regulator n=1 Tax=Brachybacterium sp. AOP42-C2-15 TaxID=3457670 RepID=UPI004033385A
MTATIVNHAPAVQDRLLTTPQVSELTGLAVATLQNMRSRGLGEGPRWVKIGRSVRYRESDCLAWIESLGTVAA